MVIDRLLFLIFTLVNTFGTVFILLQSPALFDMRPPMAIMPASKPLSGDTFEFDLLNNITTPP
jgi:hypothetical protein